MANSLPPAPTKGGSFTLKMGQAQAQAGPEI